MHTNKVLCCLLLFSLICTQLFAQDNSRKKLIIKGDINYPPYEFLNEKGEVDGYNIELTKALMEELGYDYDIELIDWGVAINMLKNKSIDLLMGATFSKERDEFFSFSTPHASIKQCFVYRKNSKKLNSLEQLLNKDIVVQSNTTAHQFLKNAGFLTSIKEYPNIKDGLKDLASGKYDVAICEEQLIQYLITNQAIEGLEYQIINNLKPIPYSYIVNKDNQDLLDDINRGLDALISNGRYHAIYNKWFSGETENKSISLLTRIIIIISLFLLLLLSVMVIAIRILTVRSTKKLKISNSELELSLKAGNLSTWTYDINTKFFYPLYGDSIIPKGGIRIEYFIQNISQEYLLPFINLINDMSSGIIKSGHIIIRYQKEEINFDKYFESEILYIKEDESSVPYLLGTHKDITAEYLHQREMDYSNRKIQLAITTSKMVLWEYNSINQSFTFTNEHLTNYDPSIEVSIETFLVVICPEDYEKTLKYTHLMDEGIEDKFEFKLHIKQNDGQYQTMIVNGSALEKDSDGRIIKYIGFRRDVTEYDNMITQLQILKDKAEKSDKLKSAFLANISHELRTPLNSIVGFSEILINSTSDEDKSQFVSIIKKNNRYLISLIDSIMDLAKIESGNLELMPYDFDFVALFKDLAEEYSQKLEGKNINFVCDVPDNHLLVFIDKERVSQVITNFLSNSIKFTEEGEIKMSYIHEDRGITIKITDTGCGISKENCGKLFNRFEKLNNYTRGSGIGLSISKAIVTAMNGEIGAESTLGKGSTFWAYIPLF